MCVRVCVFILVSTPFIYPCVRACVYVWPTVTCCFDVYVLRNVSCFHENKLQAKQKIFALKNRNGSRVSIREFNRPSLMTVTVNTDHKFAM